MISWISAVVLPLTRGRSPDRHAHRKTLKALDYYLSPGIEAGFAKFYFKGNEYQLEKQLADEFMKIREAVKSVLGH